jgi:hypothetical protein
MLENTECNTVPVRKGLCASIFILFIQYTFANWRLCAGLLGHWSCGSADDMYARLQTIPNNWCSAWSAVNRWRHKVALLPAFCLSLAHLISHPRRWANTEKKEDHIKTYITAAPAGLAVDVSTTWHSLLFLRIAGILCPSQTRKKDREERPTGEIMVVGRNKQMTLVHWYWLLKTTLSCSTWHLSTYLVHFVFSALTAKSDLQHHQW